MVQAEGFVIVEGTIEQAPSSLVQGKSELPDEEIAWELVEEPAPAAEISSSAAEGVPGVCPTQNPVLWLPICSINPACTTFACVQVHRPTLACKQLLT